MSLIERLGAGIKECEYWANDTAVQVDLADVREAARQLEAMQAEIERLRQALGDVVDPLGYCRRQAEADGRKLSGAAYGIAHDFNFVRNIARASLLDQGKG